MSEQEVIVVMTSTPDMEVAERVARALIESGLAACVQLNPGVTSLYKWDGVMQKESEVLVSIKSVAHKFPQLELVIKENHPYKVPEIISISASDVSGDYLKWMRGVL